MGEEGLPLHIAGYDDAAEEHCAIFGKGNQKYIYNKKIIIIIKKIIIIIIIR